MATQEHIEAMKSKAIDTLARTDNVAATDTEFIQFDDSRYSGQYVIVRTDGQAVAIYKVVPRLGPARGVRDEHGIVNYVVDSIAFGLKRVKRAPKGLLEQCRPNFTPHNL